MEGWVNRIPPEKWGEGNPFQYKGAWYWYDETGDTDGPYPTKEIAAACCRGYCDQMLDCLPETTWISPRERRLLILMLNFIDFIATDRPDLVEEASEFIDKRYSRKKYRPLAKRG